MLDTLDIRVGLGVDFHRFLPAKKNSQHGADGTDDGAESQHAQGQNRLLILGGVPLPNEPPLQGHSDADIILHALADAILGALAMPDIGEVFPDTEPKNRGLDSKKILDYALTQMNKNEYKLSNLDICVIAEKPKISVYKQQIRHSLQKLTGLAIARIGLKGSTSERMGALGRGDGIMCLANVLIGK